MYNQRKNIIVEQSFEFAVKIVEVCRNISFRHKEYIISQQLLKSWTSIGANIMEAQHAQSKNDFLAKLYISYKECNETLYRLMLLAHTTFLHAEEKLTLHSLQEKATELKKLLTAIIKSTKKNLDKNI